jgi:6-phosphogluconolactonase
LLNASRDRQRLSAGVKWVTCSDVAAAERAASRYLAMRLGEATRERGRATFAISGGRTPWGLFGQLASQDVDWGAVHLFQVDERIAPGHPEASNWERFRANPLAQRIPDTQQHAMPVWIDDAQAAARHYETTLISGTGEPPTLDVVHLGIGADGHTASLFADDPLSQESGRWVGVSRIHERYRRLTLTLPTLNRARCVVWFATGAERRNALTRLAAGDPSIPASLVQRDRATCFVDAEASPKD